MGPETPLLFKGFPDTRDPYNLMLRKLLSDNEKSTTARLLSFILVQYHIGHKPSVTQIIHFSEAVVIFLKSQHQ